MWRTATDCLSKQLLTLSSSAVSNGYTSKCSGTYRSNPTLALSPERQSARMSKIKNGGLDQYGAGAFEQQQSGVEGVNCCWGLERCRLDSMPQVLCSSTRSTPFVHEEALRTNTRRADVSSQKCSYRWMVRTSVSDILHIFLFIIK